MVHWLLVIAYAVSMFVFAGQQDSSAAATAQLLARWLPHFGKAEIQQLVFWIRKLGHVAAYGVLTLLVFNAVRVTSGLKRRALPLAVLSAFIVAVVDEAYQMRLPHRTGTWSDVLIDGIGIGLAAGCLHYWMVGRDKRISEEHIREDKEGPEC